MPLALASLVAAAIAVLGGGGAASAAGGGGTAKPPPGPVVAPFPVATLPDPAFTVDPKLIHGFDITGFLQDATVGNGDCPDVTDRHRFGGTAKIDGISYVIPCNLVVQMPANTLTWADMVDGGPSLALKDSPLASFEIRLVGNIVGLRHIAALAFVSQQSVKTASGAVTKIDHATGELLVDGGRGAGPVRVQINDPNGRFGRAQSPDPRFSVDDANPTIHAGTGYPMCVPRVTDDPTVAGNADDPLCPQRNRPQPTASGHCRNFTDAALVPLPASGDLPAAKAGQAYCSQFVMPATPATASDPDPTQQAPFEIGDWITYSGTLVHEAAGDYISAHTIEANVGIYTAPGTQPSYVAIGEFGVGTADPAATAINGAPQETQDRIFLEAETTDVRTPVDIYLMDVDPDTGTVRNRWVTPFEMTGENSGGNPSGGITTQYTGPQPQRARLRATKAPIGLLSQPSRTVRVVARSLCTPQAQADQSQLDQCLANAPKVANGLVAGQYYAPTFEFIFPENVRPGDIPVPNDFWHLPFLRSGEGATTPSGVGPSVGPLTPAPW